MPVEADRRQRPDRPIVATGASFTVKVERQGVRSVYACSHYNVETLPEGQGVRLIMTEHGTLTTKTVDIPSGSSVFVVNAHGATIDVIRPKAS